MTIKCLFHSVTFCCATLVLAMFGCEQNRDPNGKTSPSPSAAGPEVHSQVVEAKTGRGLLLQSKGAYQQIKRYSGTVSLEDVAVYDRGPFKSRRSLKIEFTAPADLSIEGQDSNGDPFSIASEKGKTKVSGPLNESFGRPADALLSLTGISLQGTLWLPSFLLGIDWSSEMLFVPKGDILTALSKDAELEGSEHIDGYDCWRIRCEREIQTCVIFIDKEFKIARRLELSASKAQMAKQRQEGGGGRTGEINETRSVQDFKIDQLEF